MLHFICLVLATVGLVAALPASMAGQAPTATISTWNPPRHPDGQPNVEGVWANPERARTYSVEGGNPDRQQHLNITGLDTDDRGLVIDPPDGKIPYQPWAAAKRQDISDNHMDPPSIDYIDPVARGCFLEGVPRINYQGGNTMRIIQPSGYVVMIHEFQHAYRVIPLDDRPRLADNVKLWMGESRGHWEGNTLVVEVAGNDDRTWLDIVGSFHSDALRVIERWTIANERTLNYEATLEDPNVFTRPWTISTRPFTPVEAGYEQWEDACVEGNAGVELMLQR
jgi:hypothetical protein